jgi:hypothetical protein
VGGSCIIPEAPNSIDLLTIKQILVGRYQELSFSFSVGQEEFVAMLDGGHTSVKTIFFTLVSMVVYFQRTFSDREPFLMSKTKTNVTCWDRTMW